MPQNSSNLLDSVFTVSVHDASLIRPPRGKSWRHKAGRWGLGSSGAAGNFLEDLERLGGKIERFWSQNRHSGTRVGQIWIFLVSSFMEIWRLQNQDLVPSACFVFTNSLHRNLITKFRINSLLSMRKKTQISGDSAMIESIHGALTDPLVHGPRMWIRFTRSKRHIYHCENAASLVHATAGISPSLVSERRFEIQGPTKNRIWLLPLRFLNDC